MKVNGCAIKCDANQRLPSASSSSGLDEVVIVAIDGVVLCVWSLPSRHATASYLRRQLSVNGNLLNQRNQRRDMIVI